MRLGVSSIIEEQTPMVVYVSKVQFPVKQLPVTFEGLAYPTNKPLVIAVFITGGNV